MAHYTMGAGLEAMRRETSSFYHYNHLGTALALTGADEAVSDTYRHDAWGVLLERTGGTFNPHTYVGRERYYRMPNAAMYHLGFRDYAQGLGRFTTVDPLDELIRLWAQGITDPLFVTHARLGRSAVRRRDRAGHMVPYAYAGGCVTSMTDALGLAAERRPWWWPLWPPLWRWPWEPKPEPDPGQRKPPVEPQPEPPDDPLPAPPGTPSFLRKLVYGLEVGLPYALDITVWWGVIQLASPSALAWLNTKLNHLHQNLLTECPADMDRRIQIIQEIKSMKHGPGASHPESVSARGGER